MAKLFAALIIVFLIAWLAPMCSRLPADLSVTAQRPPAAAPESVPAPAPAPAPALVPAPASAPEAPALVVSTYRTKKMFPVEKGKYQISVRRENRADADVVGVNVTLIARRKGLELERADNDSPQVLAPGSTGYYDLRVSTGAIDEILDAPFETGTELEWALTYRLEGSDARRCVRLRALPRRRDPEGIDWVFLGGSRECPPK